MIVEGFFRYLFGQTVAATQYSTSYRSIALLLLGSDLIGLLWCFNLAYWLCLEQFLNWNSPTLYWLVLLLLLGLYLADTYRPDTQIGGLRSPARVILSNLVTGGATTTVVYLAGLWGSEPLIGRGILLVSLGFFTLWTAGTRLFADKWIQLSAKQSRWLVLGGGENAVQFGLEFRFFNPQAELVVLVENQKCVKRVTYESLSSLGYSLDDFDTWSEQEWSGVVIGTTTGLSDVFTKQLMQMRLRGVIIYSLTDFYERYWFKIPPSYLKDDWFAFTSGFRLLHNRVSLKIKRLVDILSSGLLLLLLAPVMLLTALAIKFDSPGAVFYSQVRTGLNCKKFKVYKFRSMYQDAERRGAQWASKGDPRITTVGRFLRVMRIDELPQLWNVLKGEMSIIGPRPERPEFDAQLSQAIPYYDVRYLIKPGITGWAQVMYPYGASITDAYEKLAYDLYYIKNYSLLLDLAIAFKTLRVVLLGKGQ